MYRAFVKSCRERRGFSGIVALRRHAERRLVLLGFLQDLFQNIPHADARQTGQELNGNEFRVAVSRYPISRMNCSK
jgi:hypothetical protein